MPLHDSYSESFDQEKPYRHSESQPRYAIAMAKTKALAPERNEALRRIARDVVAEYGDQKRAAAAIGIAQPFLSDFLGGKRGAGTNLIQGLMMLRPQETAAVVFPRSDRVVVSNGPPKRVEVVYEARYPEVVQAIRERIEEIDDAMSERLQARAAHTGTGKTISIETARAWVAEEIAESKGKLVGERTYQGGDDLPPAGRKKPAKRRTARRG